MTAPKEPLSGSEPGETKPPRVSRPGKGLYALSGAFLRLTEATLDAAWALERYLHTWHVGEGRDPRRCRLCAAEMSPRWDGEICCMCNGSGRDASYITEPSGNGMQRVVGRVENGRACRACNGHGRDPV